MARISQLPCRPLWLGNESQQKTVLKIAYIHHLNDEREFKIIITKRTSGHYMHVGKIMEGIETLSIPWYMMLMTMGGGYHDRNEDHKKLKSLTLIHFH